MIAMGFTTDTSSRAVPALLVAAVASIVLGIVGMHALDTHGVVSTTDHPVTISHETGPVTVAHGDMSAGTIAGDATGGDGHSLGSMVMLYFVMLAVTAGALVLLLLGRRRSPRVWTHRLTAPISVTRRVTARLGTGPPHVWQFSVIRC